MVNRREVKKLKRRAGTPAPDSEERWEREALRDTVSGTVDKARAMRASRAAGKPPELEAPELAQMSGQELDALELSFYPTPAPPVIVEARAAQRERLKAEEPPEHVAWLLSFKESALETARREIAADAGR